MPKMRVQFVPGAFRALRSEPGVVGDLEARARRVQAAAAQSHGGTYMLSTRMGLAKPQGRWRTSVVTADHRAIRKNAKYNTLLKALSYGRG